MMYHVSKHVIWRTFSMVGAIITASMLLSGNCLAALGASKTAAKAKATEHAAPAANFTLADEDGKPRRLSDYRGRPVALYFFCGCRWCHNCARIWGQMQRTGALTPASSPAAAGHAPITVVVFAGDAKETRQFEAETGLDPAGTVMLPDADMHVTEDYDAEPCPRVFIVNPAGLVVYTNDHADDAAREAPEKVIAFRAMTALRKAAG